MVEFFAMDFCFLDFGFRWGLGLARIGWFDLAWWWCGGGVVAIVVGGVWSSWVTMVGLFGRRLSWWVCYCYVLCPLCWFDIK